MSHPLPLSAAEKLLKSFEKAVKEQEQLGDPDIFIKRENQNVTIKTNYYQRGVTPFEVDFNFSLQDNQEEDFVLITAVYHLNGYLDKESQPVRRMYQYKIPKEAIVGRGSICRYYVMNVVNSYLDRLFVVDHPNHYYVKVFYDDIQEKTNGYKLVNLLNKDKQRNYHDLDLNKEHLPFRGMALTLNQVLYGNVSDTTEGGNPCLNYKTHPERLPNLIGNEEDKTIRLYRPGKPAVEIGLWKCVDVEQLFNEYLYPDTLSTPSPLAKSLGLEKKEDYQLDNVVSQLSRVRQTNKERTKMLFNDAIEEIFNPIGIRVDMTNLNQHPGDPFGNPWKQMVIYKLTKGDREGCYSLEMNPVYDELQLVNFKLVKMMAGDDSRDYASSITLSKDKDVASEQVKQYFDNTTISYTQLQAVLNECLTNKWNIMEVHDFHRGRNREYKIFYTDYEGMRTQVELSRIYVDEDIHIQLNVEITEYDEQWDESVETTVPLSLKHRYGISIPADTTSPIQHALEKHLIPLFKKIESLTKQYRQVKWKDCL